jgi:hypothetical protein
MMLGTLPASLAGGKVLPDIKSAARSAMPEFAFRPI